VLTQESNRADSRIGKAIDLVNGGGEAEAGPGQGSTTVMAMQGLGAMVAAMDANAGGIEQFG
jgi:hypothetical protein